MATLLLRGGSISVFDYRCGAGPADKPFVERHDGFSVSYVRKGSFGYHARGASFELVAGSILVGYPGDEYMCTHEHGCGDECLSFVLAPALVERIDAEFAMGRRDVWRTGCVPPLPQLVVMGELAQAAAEGTSAVGLDEIGILFAARFVEIVSEQKRRAPEAGARDRRCAVAAALWIDEHSHEPSIWRVQRGRSGSAPSTFCGCSRGCSG